MLRHLSLKDFVIVAGLELDFGPGFAALTGETGAGKSILIDALQLALGSRGDAGVVREGAPRAEVAAEFDTPRALTAWLDGAGFEPAETLLLRRVIDGQGKSRAWINGSPATLTQLREAADHLLDIHGQHAWQGLTRPASVRELLDAYAGLDTAALAQAFAAWREAAEAMLRAQTKSGEIQTERERLAWQIGEIDKLAPRHGEWDELNAEHQRLSHGQALLDAARNAIEALSEAEASAESQLSRALNSLEEVLDFDTELQSPVEALRGAQAQIQDAVHELSRYLSGTELDPDRMQQLDERVGVWLALARRLRRQPADLPQVLDDWRAELAALDASADLAQLEAALATARKHYDREAAAVSRLRKAAAPKLSAAVTQAMQQLGMAGGRFAVELLEQAEPQSFGRESAEFLVAGHAGSTPRPLGKVASGGELSRIALAIAVTTCQQDRGGVATLIFDEIDAGVGGAVAETVGRLMKQLGRERQVLAVTHLPQVAACAEQHLVVAKRLVGKATQSEVRPVVGEERVAEIARMLGGERLSSTSLAHAQEMLATSAERGSEVKS